MRTNVSIVYPIVLHEGRSAFTTMRHMYANYNDPNLSFWGDLLDYCENGVVRVSPTAMVLAKPCRDERGDFWFVRAGCGSLVELVSMMPFFLERIMWCRRNDGVIREYKTQKLLNKVAARMKK